MRTPKRKKYNHADLIVIGGGAGLAGAIAAAEKGMKVVVLE